SSHILQLHSFPTRRSSDLIFCGRERPRGVDGENCDIKAASDDTSADLRDMSLDTAYVRRIARRDVENCLPPGGPRRQTEPALPRSEEHTSELQSRGHLVCR